MELSGRSNFKVKKMSETKPTQEDIENPQRFVGEGLGAPEAKIAIKGNQRRLQIGVMGSAQDLNYGRQLEYIEKTKLLYQIFFKKLDEKEKTLIFDEFMRNFTINSMEMEGGTISYKIAKAIDENKKFKIDSKIDEKDIIYSPRDTRWLVHGSPLRVFNPLPLR